jgi:hypothetical protein
MAFFTCDACDGDGEHVYDTTRKWDDSPSERAERCERCEGFGTLWIEDDELEPADAA